VASSEPGAGVMDISRAIDVGQWSRFQKFAVLIAALAIVLDGFANQVLALSIPMLIKMWHVSREDFQWVQVVGYAGMAVGTISFGILGDKAGRRPVLIGCVLLFAAPTLAIAFIHGVPLLYPLRFIGGLGLGGCMPNAAALLAELTPARNRPLAVTGGIVGIPIGGTLGGFIAAGVPAEHWSTLFLMGGAVPIVIAVIMVFVLPESPRYLAVRPDRRPELVRLMARFNNPIDPTAQVVDSLDKPQIRQKVSLASLLARDYRLDTVGLWGAMFFTLLSVFGVINWLPAILAQAHYPPPMTGSGLMWFNLGGVAAALAGAATFNRFGSKMALVTMAGGAILSSIWLGLIPLDPAASPTTLLVALTLQGGFINGVQTTMYALAAFVYPTEIRGAGIGWAVGVGRLGAIVSPLVGIYLLHAAGPHGFFIGFGVTMTLSLLSILLIRRHLPRRVKIVDAIPAMKA
jgi:AAHS family 4-hydroxybenzoate transporter-like MFS transporter